MGFIRYKVGGTELEVDYFTFSGGEVHITLPPCNEPGINRKVTVMACLQDSDEVMALALAADALRNRYRGAQFKLFIPYFPYARQDRRCNPNEAHSLRVFARIVNSLNMDEVIVIDPHSDVVEALVDNVSVVGQASILQLYREVWFGHEPIYVVSPDEGSSKKAFRAARSLKAKGVIRAEKQRDLKTGDITSTEVVTDLAALDLKGHKVVVVDDICDGGRTFTQLGEKLVSQGVSPDQLSLYVTHGIFSRGLNELLKYYGHIFTTNSFRQGIEHERLTAIDVWK